MNTHKLRNLSISEKILSVFLLVSLTPILVFTYVSNSYLSEVIEKESHENLIKHAKSYGLFTFEKIINLYDQLDNISQLTDNRLSSNIISNFEHLELIQSPALSDKESNSIFRSKLKYTVDVNNDIQLFFEKHHRDSANNLYILKATFTLDTLFPSTSESPFNEPICIYAESGVVLFCNEDVALKEAAVKNASNFLRGSNIIVDYQYEEKVYELTAWELFLPSRFQSETWYFVILKEQSAILEAINTFKNFVVPIALIFMILISYAIYRFIKRLMSPLNQLNSATKMITQGQLEISLDITSKDEFKVLGDSFSNMATTLAHHQNKDDVLSKLERDILSHSNVHTAIKKNMASVATLFNAKWIILSFIDPNNKEKMDSHCLLSTGENKQTSYAHTNHDTFNLDKHHEDIRTLSNNEFRVEYKQVAVAFSAEKILAKKLTLNNNTIGVIFISTNNNEQLSSLCTSNLIEFSERFSTIYSTYQQRSELYYKAHFDSLTKLPNRSHLLEQLKKMWPHAIENKSNLTILFIDLDNFKNVNDLSGHKAGNEVLFEVAKRLSNCISDQELLARLSGDEFCILSYSSKDLEDLMNLAENIINLIKQPFVINDMSFFLGASVGMARGPENCIGPESLLEQADLAMYKAKQEGKDRYVIYNADIEQERNYRLSLEHYLHFALKNNEIFLTYQPKIDLHSGKMTSAECLARWHQTDLGLIPTDKFITLAEESGMILEIGEWILRKACYQYIDWMNKDISLDSIAVNVSARQLAARNFSDIVAATIEETQIPAHCLDLEITESAFIDDESLLNIELKKLHSLGVKISIDDFGKEYSSLSYLKKIPFDTLKIDREFIIDLETDKRDQQIIDVIINIGHTLNKKIVAEGIETINQRDILKSYGCDIGQGYLFSRPLSDIQFLEFAAKYRRQGMITETLKALNA